MSELRISISSIVVTFLLFSTCVSAQDKNGYIFTCPRSLKTGASNELQLRRYGNLEAGELRLKVFYTDSQSSNESLALEETFEIEEGVDNTKLNIKIKPFENYVYSGRVSINGTFGDYQIEGSDKVYFSAVKENIVIIQTDKPLYKPGQTVKFRVLNVDKNLKPVGDVKAEIWVRDANDVRLFQWNKDSLESGLIQDEFPLADEPSQGTWKISVSINEETTTTTFDVKEYVLPKYEVTITPPPFVLSNAEEILVKICAKYTYGQPVEGKLRMNISLETYTWSTEKIPVLEEEFEINGCYEYTINVSLVETENYYRYRRIQLSVGVEDATGTQINKTEYIQRQYSPLNMNFYQDQRQYFKPGLPYNGKLQVNNPDGTPAASEDVEICFTVSRERVLSDWWATRKIKTCSNYTSGDDGVIPYIIPPQKTDSVSVYLEAKSLKYGRKGKGTHRENSLNQPQTSMSLSPFYSPSGSFVQLQPIEETLLCGTKATVKLLFTSKEDGDFRFHYQVVSQGEVMKTGIVEKSFSTTDDVSNQFEDQDRLVNDQETQILPAIDSSREKAPEEECPSAKEARYVPPIGSVDLELDVDPSLSPNFHLLVYYIRDDRETVADSQRFKVEKCFKNQVKFQFGDEVKQPGTKTSVKVSASPNSLCGIKVVDKSVTLLDSNDQLTKEKVFGLRESLDNGMYYSVNHCNEPVAQPGLYRSSPGVIRPPKPWSYSSYEDSLTSFETAGYVVISDLILMTRPCRTRDGGQINVAYESDSMGFSADRGGAVALASTARRPAAPAAQGFGGGNEGMSTKSVVEVRNYFPETWLFELEMTGEDGVYIQKEKLPHTITEWIGSAACINAEYGLGVSDTTSIKGFQAFFISYTLPYSVVRGEEFWAKVSVFNYVSEALPIRVSLDESDAFEVTSDSIADEICVFPSTSHNFKIKIKPSKLGTVNITFRAETATSSNICGSAEVSDAYAKDAISDSIIVEAEGWPSEEVESTLFCPKEEEDGVFKEKFTQKLPEDLIEDSARAYLYLSGNILGLSLENLGNLLSIPTGCGEQNMVKLVPNIVVLELLTDAKQLTDQMKSRILRNLNTGYQRQLTYKRNDGSFSAFGSRDKEGSMFLTAMVLWYFSEASTHIAIDNSTIAAMQYWITSKQLENGCFPDVGKIIDRGLQGGINSSGATTAYVLISLMKSQYENKTHIDSALLCMKNNPQENAYGKFLYAYAEALVGNQDRAKEIIEDAQKYAVTGNGQEHYPIVNASKSTEIETASYAILANLAVGKSASSVLPIVRYLTKQMNPSGGFSSTQDTCVGLTALGEIAKLTYQDPLDLKVKANGALDEEIVLSEEDRLVVKKRKIPEVPSEFEIEATGTGCAVMQHVVRFNTKSPPQKKFFQLEVDGDCVDDDCTKRTISVLVGYIPEDKKTGMAVVEVKMISGIVPVRESLNKLLTDKDLKAMRVDVESNKVVIYFLEITNDIKQFIFEVEQVIAVPNSQPGSVKVYDYYNRDISGNTEYSFSSSSETP